MAHPSLPDAQTSFYTRSARPHAHRLRARGNRRPRLQAPTTPLRRDAPALARHESLDFSLTRHTSPPWRRNPLIADLERPGVSHRQTPYRPKSHTNGSDDEQIEVLTTRFFPRVAGHDRRTGLEQRVPLHHPRGIPTATDHNDTCNANSLEEYLTTPKPTQFRDRRADYWFFPRSPHRLSPRRPSATFSFGRDRKARPIRQLDTLSTEMVPHQTRTVPAPTFHAVIPCETLALDSLRPGAQFPQLTATPTSNGPRVPK